MKPYITLKICFSLTILALSFCSQSAMAQGNFVSNGSFDATASGWTTMNINTAIGAGYQSTKGNPGGYFLLFSSSLTPTISQTINGLIPGSNYVVLGDYAFEAGPVGGSGSTPSFGVAMDGVFLFEGATTAGWQGFNFLYTATSSSAVLSLSAQINGTDVAYGIDNISMQATPEPGSLCLIGLGGIVSTMLFRSRRKSLL